MSSILFDALVISALLYGGVFLMIKINPRAQLHNYPTQIKETQPPKTKAEKTVFLAVGIPVFACLAAYIPLSFSARFHGSGIAYLNVLFYWVSVHLIVSAVDLLLCDYLIFCTVTPKFVVIPGTEGNPAYKDKSFHTKTIPTMLLVSIVLGAICSLTYFLV